MRRQQRSRDLAAAAADLSLQLAVLTQQTDMDGSGKLAAAAADAHGRSWHFATGEPERRHVGYEVECVAKLGQ